MTEPYKLEIIEDIHGLRELGSDWNEAAPIQDVEPWQSFSWMEAAASSYGDSHSLRVLTIRKDGLLTAIAPMVLKPSDQPLRPLRLDILGGEELKEPNRLVSLEQTSLGLLIDNLASEPVYPIRLSRIPGDEECLGVIMTKFRNAGWITRTLRMPYPYLELGPNPIKKSLREDLRRAKRKAEALGEVKSAVVSASTEKELLEQLEMGLRIEASGWKGRNGTAIISNGFRKKFFERYACSAWREGSLRLRFLYVNKAAVAVQFAVESAKASWLLNIGYDEQYQQCSPGNLLLGFSIEDSARCGLARYNLLGKDEPWIKHWTTTSRDSQVLAAYRPNLHGFRAMMSDALYMLRKRLKDRRTESVKKSSRSSEKG